MDNGYNRYNNGVKNHRTVKSLPPPPPECFTIRSHTGDERHRAARVSARPAHSTQVPRPPCTVGRLSFGYAGFNARKDLRAGKIILH